MIRTCHPVWDREAGGECPMPSPNTRPVHILIVEDSPDDAELMMEALRESTLGSRMSLVEDGEDAIRFLRRQSPYEDTPHPDLILLDLYLPRKSGFEVLAELKQDPELRRLPVVIITGSVREESFIEAYNLHANCCVSKPKDQDEYALAVKKIEHFWLTVAQRMRWA